MFQAKVLGTLAIADVLADRPQATLVLFSSVNGDLGGSSFGAYSAANGFLSGFADHWHHVLGRDVHCLAWSMWADIGMNRSGSAVAAQSRGFRSLSVTEGLAAFLAAMSMPAHHLLIGLDIDNPHIVAELATDDLTAAEVVLAYTAPEDLPADALRAATSTLTAQCPVPVRFQRLPALPRGTDGSIDTVQVLTDTAASASGARYVEPANDLERQLSTLWAEVLNRPAIGRHDSFFELGGNSVRAVQLVTRINDRLASDLVVHQLYEHPTIGQLALAFGDASGRE
jgi:aryl carrier-like protein